MRLLIICFFIMIVNFVAILYKLDSARGEIKQLTAERDAARAEASTRFSSCYEMAKDPVIKQQFLESK